MAHVATGVVVDGAIGEVGTVYVARCGPTGNRNYPCRAPEQGKKLWVKYAISARRTCASSYEKCSECTYPSTRGRHILSGNARTMRLLHQHNGKYHAHSPPPHHLPLPEMPVVQNHTAAQRCTHARRSGRHVPPVWSYRPAPSRHPAQAQRRQKTQPNLSECSQQPLQTVERMDPKNATFAYNS